MTILISTLAVAFAAFCVWLTMRIVNRRERWAKWTAAALVPVVAYPLSFGPACWLCNRGYFGVHFVAITHRPIVWAAWHGPWQLRLLIYKYEANCQGRSGAYGERYFENQEIILRQLEKLDPQWKGSFSLNAGYGNFNDEPGAKSPIANAAPMWTYPLFRTD
jgi:predicted permease